MPRTSPKLDTDEIIRRYAKGESVHEIAEHLNTYGVKIFRVLKKAGIRRRSRSEAQIQALKTGRHIHPTEGRERTPEEKLAISNARYESWKTASKEDRSKTSKKMWKKMTKDKKAEFREKGHKAVREASKKGSKLERYLCDGLMIAGFEVKFHTQNVIANVSMHLDLFLPEQKVAIEIDGPSHFMPIWGEENLKKHQKADNLKNGLLLNNGYNILRIKNMSRSLSEAKKRDVLQRIIEAIGSFDSKPSLLTMEVT